MTIEESIAAQVEDKVESFDLDQAEDEAEFDANNSESAPEQNEQETEEGAAEEKPEKVDAVQERINKEVARRHAEKRRADELQRQLDELSKEKLKEQVKRPEIEDFDFDDDAHRAALIEYQVQKAINDRDEKQSATEGVARAQAQQDVFNERVKQLGKADFWEVADAVPTLAPELVSTLMESEEGASMIYHMGKNLDLADKLASMNPHKALIEIGRISANLAKKPTVKLSAAPEPIEPINSGGSLTRDRGPDGATYE
jgi:hypothetical protein